MENSISILILFCFPFVWCLVSWLLAVLGGWSSLASQYGTSELPSHIKWHYWKSIDLKRTRMPPAHYVKVASMAYDDDALYLSTFVIFRFGHAMLKLPYRDMEIETKETFIRGAISVRMRREAGIQLVLFGGDKDRLLEKIKTL